MSDRKLPALVRRLVLAVLAAGALSQLAAAQDAAPANGAQDRGPRFFLAMTERATPVPVDARQVAALRRRITTDLVMVPLSKVLREIAAQAGFRLAYSPDVVRLDRRVNLQARNITAAAALTEVLADERVDVVLSGRNQLGLVRWGGATLVDRTLQGAITGVVTDLKTHEQLSRVDVFLDGTRWRTTTDSSGRYVLADVDSGTYTLVARRFGYNKGSQAVTVREGQTDTVNLALQPVATRLNELVSTATGLRRRMDIANDVTTINADSVVRTEPIASVTDLLEGRVPGLTVQHTSGAPGDPARLRLRGAGSPLHGNDPIVIVDGIRVYAEQSAARSANLASRRSKGDTALNAAYAAPSPLDYIDPNTIETIEVIKGPSAATLYGPDAANGVIVITTKKGKAGPTRWTFMADHGENRVPGTFPALSVRWGHKPYVPDEPILCPRGSGTPCVVDSVATYQFLNDPALTVLDNGSLNDFTLGASGGTQALTYAVTGSYKRDVGLFKLPGYEADRYQTLHGGQAAPDWMQRPQRLTQWGVTSNVAARLGSTADVTLSSRFSRTAQQRSSLERQFGSLLTTFFDRASSQYYYAPFGTITSNNGVILSNYYQRATAAAVQFDNGLNLSWRPRPWLTVTSDAGLSVVQRNDEVFLPRGTTIGTAADTLGALSNGHGSSLMSTVNLRGVANIPLRLGIRLNLGVGANYTGSSISDLTVGTTNLAPGTRSLGTVVTGQPVRNVWDVATFGWYVEQSLTHRKFSLSTGLRLDGSSNYGTRVSSSGGGGLPKLGFSYLLSDEPFFPFKDLFQSFRVRAAYGRAGRQPGIAERLRLYTAGQSDWVDGQLINATELQTLGNTELRPERTTESEGGFDADLLDSRLSISFSGYRKTTDDAILNVPLAASVYGDVSIAKNIGVVRNGGIEATVTTQLVRSRPVTLGADLIIQRNRSLVVRLAPGVLPFYVQNTGNPGSALRVAPGYPLFGRWERPIVGYADANGDGVLQASEVVLGDTAVYVGSSVPTYQADLHTNLSFWQGAVTVRVGLHYDDGFSQFNQVAQTLAPFSTAQTSDAATLAEQAATMYLPTTNYNLVQAVHVFRLGDLSLAYRVPSALARRVGAQALSVAVQGTNLGLWTNYQGLDPNVNSFATGNAAVTDNGVLPQLRTWQVRINATY